MSSHHVFIYYMKLFHSWPFVLLTNSHKLLNFGYVLKVYSLCLWDSKSSIRAVCECTGAFTLRILRVRTLETWIVVGIFRECKLFSHLKHTLSVINLHASKRNRKIILIYIRTWKHTSTHVHIKSSSEPLYIRYSMIWYRVIIPTKLGDSLSLH